MAQQTLSKMFASKKSAQSFLEPEPTFKQAAPQDLIPWVEK
jgi:hypothetical protein